MQTYSYKAIREDGSKITGTLEADTAATANETIVSMGHIPTNVRVVRKVPTSFDTTEMMWKMTSVKPHQLVLFTKQLSTLIRTGVPIIRSMEILSTQTDNKKLQTIALLLRDDLKDGISLSNSLRKHPDVFSHLYIGMVYAGETSGAMPVVLERLTYVIEHEFKVKNDIKSALRYPMMVLYALGAAFFVLLNYVVPKFVRVFERTGLELPWPTKVCLTLSEFMDNHWKLILITLSIVISGSWLFFRSNQGRYIKDLMMLKAPIIGPVMVKAANSRFASILAILQSTGVAILDAMNILIQTMGNEAVSREIRMVQERLGEGHGIARPLQSAKFFTTMMVNMVAIGEEAGTLDEMMGEVSKHYDTEVEYALKQMADSIGPVLVILLSGVVGFFALAIYLPMWDMSKMVH